ncbi:MAG: putative sugar O-methyltransferase [Alphaproteobacteria bacterium]|nr:putative sugar O-methyltransferase [Alphaproteobacteria bacterium]
MTKTSMSDTDEYREICRRAAEDDVLFATFREHPTYRFVVATEFQFLGLDYWLALQDRGFDPAFFDKVRDLDALGGVTTIAFDEAGTVAPQTMRYVKIASDLEQLFGALDGQHVIEIGGGFGGQCAAIMRRFAVASYTLVDLPEPLALARRYLDTLGITGVRFAELDTLPDGATYDLAISCYAWSEMERSIQTAYADRVFRKAAAGYLALNSNALRRAETWQQRVFGGTMLYTEDLQALLPQSRLVPELRTVEERHWDVHILVWGPAAA